MYLKIKIPKDSFSLLKINYFKTENLSHHKYHIKFVIH